MTKESVGFPEHWAEAAWEESSLGFRGSSIVHDIELKKIGAVLSANEIIQLSLTTRSSKLSSFRHGLQEV
jgi:hypothetical protein